MTDFSNPNKTNDKITSTTTSATTSTTTNTTTTTTTHKPTKNEFVIDPELKELRIGRLATSEEIEHFSETNFLLKDISTELKSQINLILATLKGSGGDTMPDDSSSSGGGAALAKQEELLNLIENLMNNITTCEQASNMNSDRLNTILANKEMIKNNERIMEVRKNQLVKQYKEVQEAKNIQKNTGVLTNTK